MAYAPIMNAFRLTGEEAGGQPDYMNALMKGLQGAQTSAETVSKPSDLAAKLLAAQLENKINTPKAEDALGWYQAQKNLLQAQAAKANTPSSGFQLSIDPTTGALTSLSMGGSGQRGAANAIQGVDAQGNPIVVSPSTTASRTAEQTAGGSQAVRQSVEPIAKMPYLGIGGSLNLTNDYYNYVNSKDAKAADKLVQAAAVSMIAPDLALNQLKAQGTPVTNVSIAHQLKSLQKGWPTVTKKILDNLPPELQEKAQSRYQELMDLMSSSKQTYAAKGHPIQLQKITEGQQPSGKVTPTSLDQERVWDEQRAIRFNVSPSKILEARAAGVNSDRAMQEYLRTHP